MYAGQEPPDGPLDGCALLAKDQVGASGEGQFTDWRGSVNKRTDWTVSFGVNRLEQEAAARADYHRTRESYWEEHRAVKDAELEKTARVEEQPVTGGKQRFLRYDPGLQEQVNLATRKRDEHRSRAEEYERFLLMFEVGDEERFYLAVDDVQFFFAPIPDGQTESRGSPS
jgi:hypothetical protein